MTIFDKHKNFAYTLVAVPPTPAVSGTVLTVAAGTGSRFPVPPFNATICQYGVVPIPPTAEMVRVTNVTGDILTIVRVLQL